MFWGMAATFVLLAILPTMEGRMYWAFIPAVVLFLLGAFFLLPSLARAQADTLPLFWLDHRFHLEVVGTRER